MACLIASRSIYNEMLAALKAQYTANGTLPSKYDMTAQFKRRGGESVPASTVQTLADRLSKALKRYLQRKDLGLPVGFPRFKTPNRWHSIQLRQYAMSRDVWLDDEGKYLHVPAKLGKVLKIKLHRPLEGTPVTAHLVLRADGHWYVHIVCETAPQDEFGRVHERKSESPALLCAHPAIGLDVGLKVSLPTLMGNQWRTLVTFAKGKNVSPAHNAQFVTVTRTAIAAAKRVAKSLQSISRQLASVATFTSRRPNRTLSDTVAFVSKT